jgi:hypothetical protein
MTRRRSLPGALLFASLGSVWFADSIEAQQYPRDEYLRFVPLEVPRIIRQTPASDRLSLYGDRQAPEYRDVDPVDGVDDRRARVLHELGVRFAPFLVQNSEQVPMDHKNVWGGPYLLHADEWNTAMGLDLVRQRTINWRETASDPCTAANPDADDCVLLELLNKYNPDAPGYAADHTGAQDAPTRPFEVLWIDMPGEGEGTWKTHWENQFSGRLRTDHRDLVKTYVHPFLEDVRAADGDGVQLVLQYWFFYPYNDGGNNHEGDWEHIHVVVSPKRFVERSSVPEADMNRLLDGEWLDSTGDDQLVIKRVEYYFHSKVAHLEFGMPNAYAPRDVWARQADSLGIDLSGEDLFREYVRRLAWRDEAETEINTHTVGYIGADNKGLDQVLAAPGGKNRDSHGTYPVVGLFKDIGPAGASETITNYFNHQKFYAGDQKTVERLDSFRRGGVVYLGSPDRVELVPDYERVNDLVFSDPLVRQEWSWLVLPMRWGYPAVHSPLAGIVANAETGNLSIVGPAFNTGWNRSGENVQYKAYVPHVLPRLFPTGLQDAFANDWGYFNLTLPAATFFPPFDVAWRVVAAPFRAAFTTLEPTMYPSETIPYRFVGLEGGVSFNEPPEAYQELFLNKEQFSGIAVGVLEHLIEQGADSTTVSGESVSTIEKKVVPLFRIRLFNGSRLSSTNTLLHFRSKLEQRVGFNNIDDLSLTGALNWWEYQGSLNYSILTGGIRPYLKAGYGLSWYRLEDVAVSGTLIDTPNSPWVRKPGFIENLLPNTWHVGGGLELIAKKGHGSVPGGLDFALTAEWVYLTNKLGIGDTGAAIEDIIDAGLPADDIPVERWIGRSVLNLTATISF